MPANNQLSPTPNINALILGLTEIQRIIADTGLFVFNGEDYSWKFNDIIKEIENDRDKGESKLEENLAKVGLSGDLLSAKIGLLSLLLKEKKLLESRDLLTTTLDSLQSAWDNLIPAEAKFGIDFLKELFTLVYLLRTSRTGGSIAEFIYGLFGR